MIRAALALAAFLWAADVHACPNPGAEGVVVRLGSAEAYVPQKMAFAVEAMVDLAPCPMPGEGWVGDRPTFTLHYDDEVLNGDEASRRLLELRVTSDCDATLLVARNGGDWQFDDDSQGALDPKLRLSKARSGTYAMWIGRYEGPGPCMGVLTIETFGEPPEPRATPSRRPAGTAAVVPPPSARAAQSADLRPSHRRAMWPDAR